MSASFKLAKKVSQHDLRKLMQEQKQSRASTNVKIDSPFAKYDNDQLSCQLCKSIVRSANVWKVHVNSKQHKESLALAKQLKEKIETHKVPAMEARLAALKRMRSETIDSEVPEKKLKGILKNSSSTVTASSTDVEMKEAPSEPTTSAAKPIPDDFFDSAPKPANTETLPEGFFDDKIKDAKARNVKEYRDPTEEEWDRFQKEIKEAEVQSMTIIHEEQEEATVERQIDEIDAQIKNWNRLVLAIIVQVVV